MNEERTVVLPEKTRGTGVLNSRGETSLLRMEKGSLKKNGEGKGEHEQKKSGWLGPLILLVSVLAVAGALAVWKMKAMKAAGKAAASQPEPIESVTVAVAREQEHRRTTVSIGTVVALRSITLRNELPGTVREVSLAPGQLVEGGALLLALDTAVEEAELKAQEAQAALAETLMNRMQRGVQSRATSQMELDRARAELDVAKAQIERIKAVIARKTIRAPFRARIGISDVHPGQYLVEGTLLTTLQGVDPSAHVDFTVPQQVAQTLREGETVEILSGGNDAVSAKIIALDARIDAVTRNAMVRARVESAESVPAPGASVRVRVPVGPGVKAVSIPVSALRKGPGGDHVFVVGPDKDGKTRAQMKWVQTGPVLGDEVMILSGLAPGDQVAAAGSFKLREKVLVAIANQNGATNLN